MPSGKSYKKKLRKKLSDLRSTQSEKGGLPASAMIVPSYFMQILSFFQDCQQRYELTPLTVRALLMLAYVNEWVVVGRLAELVQYVDTKHLGRLLTELHKLGYLEKTATKPMYYRITHKGQVFNKKILNDFKLYYSKTIAAYQY